MYSTLSEISNEVISELGLASGDSVQSYTDQQITIQVRRAFKHFFTKRFWDHLTHASTHTIDTGDGVSTSDLVAIPTLQDIEWVRASPFEESDNIPYKPKEVSLNPYHPYYKQLSFDHPLFETRKLQIFPITHTSEIIVRARRFPNLEATNPIVPFDSVCLVHFVTANILANDGMNPPSQQRHDALLSQRYEDLVAGEAKEVSFYSRRASGSFTVAEE